MLFGKSTKKGAGITLWGDYHDLNNLYDTISKISDSIVLKGSMSDFVLGLCYDIRHAYQNMRESKGFGNDELSKVKYYGVEILWPYFIFQVGLVRWGAGFTTTDSEQQSNLYRLEYIIETTLKESSISIADESMFWLKHFTGFSNNYHIQFLNEITYRFVFDETIHKKRINRLPAVLKMTGELSKEYKVFEEYISKLANEKGCHPDALIDLKEWPEFTW
jgi:hypothetical protein